LPPEPTEKQLKALGKILHRYLSDLTEHSELPGDGSLHISGHVALKRREEQMLQGLYPEFQ
jgi:hypothetical protein